MIIRFTDINNELIREFHTPYSKDTIFSGFDIAFKEILKRVKRFNVSMLMEHSDFYYTGLPFVESVDDKV